MATLKYYVAMSPDGLPCRFEPFLTEADAWLYIKGEFTERYRQQGCYKDANCERIPVDEVPTRCWVEAQDVELNALAQYFSVLLLQSEKFNVGDELVCCLDRETHDRVIAVCQREGLSWQPFEPAVSTGALVDAAEWLSVQADCTE